MIGHSLRGYDRDEVDRLLAEIADSFAAVWNERTRLYEDVLQLRKQLAELREETERAVADRGALVSKLEHAQANARDLSAAMEQLEPSEEEQRSASERTQLRDLVEKLQNERDRLQEDLRRVDSATAEERSSREKLVQFLMEALKQVEMAGPGGSKARSEPGEKRGPQDGAPGEKQTSPGSAPKDANAA